MKPRLLFGLESIQLSRTDITKLEKYQCDFLRQIQHLPEHVASCSVYVLTGLLPIEAEIHKSQLTLFGNIIRQDCVERYLAIRELAVKDLKSRSWFITIQETLFQYDLPSAHDLLANPPEKLAWKYQVKTHISEYWEKSIVNEARSKSTLRYLNFENFQIGCVHKLWTSVKYNQHSVHKAFVHVKLSVGTYIIQSNKVRVNQFQVSKLCPLCNRETESLEHFLFRCSELQRVRDPIVHQIGLLLETSVNTTGGDWAGEDIVQVILDPSMLLPWCEVKDESALDKLFSISRSLCYAMHAKHSALLDELLPMCEFLPTRGVSCLFEHI